MPRISDPAPAESISDTAQGGTANPITVVPTVQIPAPVAVQSGTEPSAPEVTSDAETLPLPGIPGAKEDGTHPSPVEEEVEPATDDPYVSTVEGATTGETADPEPSPTSAKHGLSGVPSVALRGFGGLVPVIPKPTIPEETQGTTKPVTTTTEVASKEGKEAASSGPVIPTAQPTGEAEASKPPTGEAEASKPSSGEAESSKPSVDEAKTDSPETAPKAKAKSVSTRKQKETPKETPEQKEQREKAEKAAEELVQQEDEEKKRQAAKDAKSKKAAAENKEKAREAAAQQRKTKEQAAEGEQTIAQKRRIKAATPENDPGDRPPPDGDDQPWQIYQYRPHIEE